MSNLTDTDSDMPFDDSKYYAAANHADVAGVAIKASLALNAVRYALLAIQSGDDLSPHIAKIKEEIDGFDEMFDTLTGWHPGER